MLVEEKKLLCWSKIFKAEKMFLGQNFLKNPSIEGFHTFCIGFFTPLEKVSHPFLKKYGNPEKMSIFTVIAVLLFNQKIMVDKSVPPSSN